MEEFNHLDFCQECYGKYIQQYFKAQDVTTSSEQPEFFQFLSKLGAWLLFIYTIWDYSSLIVFLQDWNNNWYFFIPRHDDISESCSNLIAG